MKWQWILSLLAAALLTAFLDSKAPVQPLNWAKQTPNRTQTVTPSKTPTGTPAAPPIPPEKRPYLELSVQPEIAAPGELVTLSINYVNVGMPYTYISIGPPDLAAFDPPVTMPCKYYLHPSGCKTFTLRSMVAGVVAIHAEAEGEIFDNTCNCWRFAWVGDNGPAVLFIVDTWLKTFFPFVGGR